MLIHAPPSSMGRSSSRASSSDSRMCSTPASVSPRSPIAVPSAFSAIASDSRWPTARATAIASRAHSSASARRPWSMRLFASWDSSFARSALCSPSGSRASPSVIASTEASCSCWLQSDWLRRSCRSAARPGSAPASTRLSARRSRASWRVGSPAWSAEYAARRSRSTSSSPASRSGSSTRSQSARARSKSACASPKAFTRSAASAARVAAARARDWSPAATQWCAACAVMCAPRSPPSIRSSSARASAAVQLGALTRQQVVVDHLAQQRVAERVALVGERDHDVARHRLAQRVAQLGRLEPRHRGEQRMVGGRLACEPAQQLLRPRREPVHAQHQRIAQRRRQRAAPVEPRGEDLLGVERVALAARVDALHELMLGAPGQDSLELLGQLLGCEARQLEKARVLVARQLREQRAQRVPAVQLVGTVGAHDQQPLGAYRAREKADEGARGAVRPVEVLHHEHDGRLIGQRLEQRQQRLEHARLGGVAGRVTAADPGHDRVDRGAVRRSERVQRRVLVAHERPQRRQQRGVRQLVLAELDAVAREHARTGLARVPLQLVGEPRLADARLTANQCERWTALGGVAQGRLQLGELSGSPDEASACHARGHGLPILPAGMTCVPNRRRRRQCRWREGGGPLVLLWSRMHLWSVDLRRPFHIGYLERLAHPDPLPG